MHTQTEFTSSDWGMYATCYDTLLYLQPYQRLLTHVLSTLTLTTPDTLLDLGCGTGNLLHQIATAHKISNLSGIDANEAMLQIATRKCTPRNLTLQTGDLNQRLPWADGAFSKITCINALYAVPRPQYTLQEAYRVLTGGGEIVIATPHQQFDDGLILKAHTGSTKPDSYWAQPHTSTAREEELLQEAIADADVLQKMLYVCRYNRQIIKTQVFHFFTEDELQNLLVHCGFTILRTTATYANQNILIHAKKEVV